MSPVPFSAMRGRPPSPSTMNRPLPCVRGVGGGSFAVPPAACFGGFAAAAAALGDASAGVVGAGTSVDGAPMGSGPAARPAGLGLPSSFRRKGTSSDSGVSIRAATAWPCRSFARSASGGLTRLTRTSHSPSPRTPYFRPAPFDRSFRRSVLACPLSFILTTILFPLSFAVTSTSLFFFWFPFSPLLASVHFVLPPFFPPFSLFSLLTLPLHLSSLLPFMALPVYQCSPRCRMAAFSLSQWTNAPPAVLWLSQWTNAPPAVV